MGFLKILYQFFFGKDYTEVWKQFAREKNGKFVKGINGNGDSVEIVYKKHKIIFDTYTHFIVVGASSATKNYTRVQLEFAMNDDFKFTIYPQEFIDAFGKFFGAQDITIGDAEFDKAFIIKSNNQTKTQLLFSDNSINDLLLLQNDFRLQIIENEGFFEEKIQQGKSMLYYISEDRIKKIEQLNTLYDLYIALLSQLIKIGSIKV